MEEIDEIEDIQLDGIDTNDYPKFCDAYISYAVWVKTGKELTDKELDILNEDGAYIHELVMDYLF